MAGRLIPRKSIKANSGKRAKENPECAVWKQRLSSEEPSEMIYAQSTGEASQGYSEHGN